MNIQEGGSIATRQLKLQPTLDGERHYSSVVGTPEDILTPRFNAMSSQTMGCSIPCTKVGC